MFKKVIYENVEILKLLKKGILNLLISNVYYFFFILVRFFYLDFLVY